MKISIDSFAYANDIKPAESISILLYGEAKTGKTDAAASAPRPLIIDTGRSKETYLSKSFRARRPNQNPLVISVWEELGKRGIPKAADAYDYTCDILDFAFKEMKDQFDTVVIDEATALGFYARVKGVAFNDSIGKSNTLDTIKKTNVLSAAIQDYGAEMDLMLQFTRGYLDIALQHNKHFILVCHEKKVFARAKKASETDKLISITPLLTGKESADKFTGLFDWVLRAETMAGSGETIYMVRTQKDSTIAAGMRHQSLFKKLEQNPNLTEFIERVKKNN